jgi:site-specific DNA recombinase
MKGIKVAVYGRVSTDEQREKQTIETQIEKAKDFCKLHEFEIHDFYLDEGISGVIPFDERPEGKRLLEDAKKKSFSAVIVYKLDRVGRDIVIIRNFLDFLSKHGIAFRSITEPFDTSTAFGKSFMELLGVFAGFERSMIMERSKAGKERIAKEGKYTGGRIPLGYRVNDNGEYEIDEEPIPSLSISPAELVRYLFKAIAYEGKGTGTLAKEMVRKGIPLPYSIYLLKQGKSENLKYSWTDNTVRKIIQNEFYKGVHYFGKWKKKNGYIERKVPALIDPETWEIANAKIKDRKLVDREKFRFYLFSSLVRCGNCGRSFVGHVQKLKRGERKAYTCVGKFKRHELDTKECKTPVVVGENDLDTIIWTEVKEWLKNPEEAVKEILQRERERYSQKEELQKRITSLEEELKRIEEKKERSSYAFINGFIPKEKYHELIEDLELQKETISLEIEELKERINLEEHTHSLNELLLTSLKRLKTLLENGKEPSLEVKRQIYLLLIDQIIVYPDYTAKVIYRFKPSQNTTFHRRFRSSTLLHTI